MIDASLLDDYRWLVGTTGQAWLARAADDDREPVALADALRRDLSSSRAHLVLEQVALRRRGRAKYADAAARMLFTRRGLEQATDRWVAGWKAQRFPVGGRVLDLCCGVGGDLIALANRGAAAGFDRDPVAAFLAAANAAALGAASARAVIADVTRLRLANDALWHIDPDRRAGRRRSVRPLWHEPDETAVSRLLASAPHGAVKLAPAADVARAWAGQAQREWIARDRQCRQQVVWFGRFAGEPGTHRATAIRAPRAGRDEAVRTLIGKPGFPSSRVDAPDRWVFEPDPAVSAAGLVGALAAQHALAALDPQGLYLTGPRPVRDLALACFEVEEVLPFDRRRLRRLLAARGIGRLEIKTRGLALDPQRLARQLQPKGDAFGVVLLIRGPGGVLAVLARRIADPADSVQESREEGSFGG
ncbi:MAG: hypothetical protein JW809_14555 [Pirellulales bacterium]|nr:hypothetical protein [Pirellulales bacterium]